MRNSRQRRCLSSGRYGPYLRLSCCRRLSQSGADRRRDNLNYAQNARGPRGGIILAKSNPTLEKKLNFSVFPESQGAADACDCGKGYLFQRSYESGVSGLPRAGHQKRSGYAQGFIDRGYDIVSGGTDDHLFLLSLIRQGITGKDADAALDEANITVNKNAVPNDPNPPFVTSD